MGRWLPALDYPAAKPGYWMPVTSTIDWCEENYYLTSYSAEIVNTLTNLLFVWLGVKGIRSCVKYGHDRVFIVSYFGYLLVGTGSFMFHTTLKYPWQLVDELSMIYTTTIMCYATFSYAQSRFIRWSLALGLFGLAAFITIYYHYLQDPLFHQNAFGVLTAAVLFRSMYVMEVNLRPSLRAKWGANDTSGKSAVEVLAERRENAARDSEILKQMWWLVSIGLAIFLGGFGIWNLDNAFCSNLRKLRRDVGLPWGIVLEGHGWWHLMTGVGAYFYLVWGVWLRHCLNGRQDEFGLRWTNKLWSIPEIVPIQQANHPAPKYSAKRVELNGNGHQNGHTNGHANGHTNGHTNGNGHSKKTA